MNMTMKALKYTLVFAIAAFSFGKVSAQQDPMYTQYMYNMLVVNPAYAGSADLLTMNAMYRDQWVDFDGAPRTQTFSMHSPLKRESISVGGSVINDSHGVMRQTMVFGDISYRIFFDKSKLAFGLKAGINLLQANLQDLNPVTDGDPAFQENINNKPLPNFGAGVMWYTDRTYVGVSVPKLLANKLIDGSLPDFNANTERQHFFLIAGTVIEINNYVQFKPSGALRVVNGAPPSFDATANFLLYERLWIGAMYRFQESTGMLFQYEVNNRLRVGYSYDYSLTDIGNYSSGSHEIMLGLDLGKNAGADVSPRFF
ncbi:PorP/SprF family type IX secretion system membrane protein [Sanyastnella coralliicola]|uniref:PorP/SprF family type IX secretion system membrane protein n=1 Tax=Sanyastnella coralliicola TaxID=3069118 RepID=UPI0027B9BC0E|nr:type IX secretion system membrane protein PorP/SprF [Longitalea sp. SCSIO 12813]